MNYEQLIETVSLMVENDKIVKEGLTLVYELSEKNHRQMDEQLFYKSNLATAKFTPSEVFEAVLGGVTVKFVKPNQEPIEE